MFSVGEFIVHPGQGVCKVEGIVQEPMAVYQLMPVGQRHPMRISFPLASADKLRPILSRQEAIEIIDEYPDMSVDPYTGKSNAIEEEHFRHKIRTGSCKDSVRIVKTFRKRIADTRARNKKPPVVYERILKQASQRSLEELAVALELTPDDVRLLFEQRVDESAN
ncbi:MAG: CarD family transcriptional regulator [Atopobiaceae bacterium]|nr:CarD family transcriptional regulator [Atopobiaceae bacterium]